MFGRFNRHPTRRDIRYFSITLLIACLLFALVLILADKSSAALRIGGAGGFLSIVCYFAPIIGRAVYLVWMGATFALGFIISPVVTALIFYLIVTPIGIFLRLAGKDRLRLKTPKNVTTYFNDYSEPSDKESFCRQF